MKKQKRLDNNIANIVQSINLSPPASLETKINTALDSTVSVSRPRSKFLIRRLIWPAISFATVVLLIVVSGVLFLQKSPTPYITEIRTEFDLPEKNITGIFILRDNFDFFEEVNK